MNLFIRDPSLRDTLQNLRHSMVKRFGWLTLTACLLGLYLSLFNVRFPVTLTVVLIGLVLAIGFVLWLLPRHPDAARYSLPLLLTSALLLAMALVPDPALPPIGLALMVLSGMTVTYGHWTTAVMLALGTAALMPAGYPIWGFIGLLTLMLALLQTSVASLYTALAWYRAMQARADALLNESREHQAKLTQTLKSLDLAYQSLNRTQQQLVIARQQADEARRLKQRFAANISHELRTPLNLIVGFSEIMVMTPEVYTDQKLPPKLARDLYQIYTSSRHLLGMIDDVLDLSQAELSSFSLNFERINVARFIDDSREIFDSIFRDGRLRFSIELAPNLPDIEMDCTRIRQVLLNLLSNAHRFTESGAVMLTVWQAGQEVLFAVSDTGRGVPPDKQAMIFEEFYQVDSSLSRRHGGAGLGLAISKRFVETHDGRIWVESEHGHGATFTFSLPVRSISAPGRAAGPDGTRSAGSLTVLVSQATPAQTLFVERALPHCRIISAPANAAENTLMALIERHAVDVVLSGQGELPTMPRPIPTITCTLPRLPDTPSQADDALFKPVSPDALLRAVTRHTIPRSVLVVTDDLGFIQLAQRALERLSPAPDVYSALSGAQGLSLTHERAPDLILLDAASTESNGFIEAVRARAIPPRVVVMSTPPALNAEGDYAAPITLTPPPQAPHRLTLASLRALTEGLSRL
jgi:signal transduction histidine kinase/CheY-like chemotaxis protein